MSSKKIIKNVWAVVSHGEYYTDACFLFLQCSIEETNKSDGYCPLNNLVKSQIQSVIDGTQRTRVMILAATGITEFGSRNLLGHQFLILDPLCSGIEY